MATDSAPKNKPKHGFVRNGEAMPASGVLTKEHTRKKPNRACLLQSRSQLNAQSLATMLKDFCAANYNGTALDVIREAVREHIERRIKETVMGERYEKARRERLGLPEKIVQLVQNGEKTE